jgi:type II secretory pathway pseudopilin PulG
MSKIVRHFKNNWYKYILEMIVVISSVLIAFALSEWAESRDLKEKKIELQSSLLDELNVIRQYGEAKINGIQNQVDLLTIISNGNEIGLDSIYSLSVNTSSGQRQIFPLHLLMAYIYQYAPRTSVYSSALNNGDLFLLDELNVNRRLATIYTSYPSQIRDIALTEGEINSELRLHISDKYQKFFENQKMTKRGWWEDETLMAVIEKIKTDGKIKLLFAEKIEIISNKIGTLYATIGTIDDVVERLKMD